MLTPGRAIVPLVDAGATDVEVQWLLATWEEDPAHPVTTGSGTTGNTQSPADPSWAITTATDGPDPTKLAIRHDGLGMGYLGLAVLPPGHYCQLTFGIPSGGYMRGLRLYAWDPETDPDRQRYPAIPDDDLALRTYGAQAVAWTIMQRDPMRALLASTSIGSAVGDLLEAHGAEWGVPRPFGGADLLYQQLVRFLSARRSQGATLRFVRQALSLLLPGVPFTVSAIPTTSTSWTLGASRLGIDTTLGSKTLNRWQAIITIPIRALTMPPQTVQQIMETFRTVGVTITYIWN